MVNAAQVRAARAWFRWSRAELARRSRVSQQSILRVELSRTIPSERTLIDIQRAFEDEGLEFLSDGPIGVGFRSHAHRAARSEQRRE